MQRMLVFLTLIVTLTLVTGSSWAHAQTQRTLATAPTAQGVFSNASFQGHYAITANVGSYVGAALGTCNMDGRGTFDCAITINAPGEAGDRMLIPLQSTGTYTVNPDGTGTVHEIETLPDGSTQEIEHAFLIVAAEAVGPFVLATEIHGYSLQPGDPSGSLLTQVLTRLPVTDMMPALAYTDNIALSAQLHEHFSNNELDSALALADEEIDIVAYAFGMHLTGKEQFMGFMQGFKTAFPDIVIQETNQFASGDQVVVEFVATGTHTGPLVTPAGEIPATGHEISLNVIEVHEWREGKLVKLVNYQDSADLLRQLGVIE